jgi:hypothetical protein
MFIKQKLINRNLKGKHNNASQDEEFFDQSIFEMPDNFLIRDFKSIISTEQKQSEMKLKK